MEKATAVLLTILTLLWVVAATQGIFIPRASHLHGLGGRYHRGKSICEFGVQAGLCATVALAIQAVLLLSDAGHAYIFYGGGLLAVAAGLTALSMNTHVLLWILPAIVAEFLIISGLNECHKY